MYDNPIVPPAEASGFERVYQRFAPVALAAARRFIQRARLEGWRVEWDDAAQIARLALWEAWRRDPECGPGFHTLVQKVTHRRLLNWLRRRVPVIRGQGADAPRVYSLETLAEMDPDGWELRVRPLGETG